MNKEQWEEEKTFFINLSTQVKLTKSVEEVIDLVVDLEKDGSEAQVREDLTRQFKAEPINWTLEFVQATVLARIDAFAIRRWLTLTNE